MSYDFTRMSLLGPASGAMLWSYRHAVDSAATIKAANYFQPVWQQLDVGDRIHVHSGDNAFFTLAVTASTVSTVTTVSNAAYA